MFGYSVDLRMDTKKTCIEKKKDLEYMFKISFSIQGSIVNINGEAYMIIQDKENLHFQDEKGFSYELQDS